MSEIPRTHYAKTGDGLSIAYQTLGEGPTDIVLLPSFGCIEVIWDEPSYAHVLNRLARIGRLICLDWSGTGLSDPSPWEGLAEERMADVLAVLDAVGSTTVTIVGHSEGGRPGMVFAATHPERTSRLVLIDDCMARHLPADDYPNGMAPEIIEAAPRYMAEIWGTGAVGLALAPSRHSDKAFRRWLARMERLSSSPGRVEEAVRWYMNLDVRPVLPAIRVPTLLLWREGGTPTRLWNGRYLADHITDAKLVLVPGADEWFFTEAADEIVDHIAEFVTGVPPVREPDRALATVLFTDFVSSTPKVAEVGDKRWSQVLDQHDAIVARELDRHRGRKVNPTGDGILATFDGPARAVRCAQAIIEAIKPLGIEVRAGLHTGEVELRGEDIGGIAVHIGRRVSDLAGAGEVLVSSTVKDLVAGSGIVFADRGTHALKGVPDEWRLFSVEP